MNFIIILKKQNDNGVLRKSNIFGNGGGLVECVNTYNSIKELLTNKVGPILDPSWYLCPFGRDKLSA